MLFLFYCPQLWYGIAAISMGFAACEALDTFMDKKFKEKENEEH